MPGYLLDASAIVCFLDDEEGANQVGDVLRRSGSAPILIPFAALMEVEYKLYRSSGPQAVAITLRTIESWQGRIPESTPSWRHEAARIKAGGGLSYADAWTAALALIEDAQLVHKDPGYDTVPGLKALRLPYKDSPRRRR